MNPSGVFLSVRGCATVAVIFLLATSVRAGSEGNPADDKVEKKTEYRGIIGPESKKIKIEGDKTLVWGGVNPKTGREEWYDFTGAPFDAADLQFGIGKYRIVAIDDPMFVEPTDRRLMNVPVSPYRKDERPKTPDDIMVIGWVEGDDVRAYPISLLDRHELVNDTIGGKPVTVGW
ncbi:MAG: hypothetical protein DHS20C16_27540 [Phycisphaerae bacterium]|nr:MAG: hypothetical protein DHS20C16_27540 [Phycisphaerae bacterium]